MSIIKQQIALTCGRLTRLTEDIFSRANLTLRDLLGDQVGSRGHRALIVMNETLQRAKTGFLNELQAHLKRHAKHEINLLIIVNSISELCDYQAAREQSHIPARA